MCDLAEMRKLGLPFWLAGGYGKRGGLQEALAEGARLASKELWKKSAAKKAPVKKFVAKSAAKKKPAKKKARAKR